MMSQFLNLFLVCWGGFSFKKNLDLLNERMIVDDLEGGLYRSFYILCGFFCI